MGSDRSTALEGQYWSPRLAETWFERLIQEGRMLEEILIETDSFVGFVDLLMQVMLSVGVADRRNHPVVGLP